MLRLKAAPKKIKTSLGFRRIFSQYSVVFKCSISALFENNAILSAVLNVSCATSMVGVRSGNTIALMAIAPLCKIKIYSKWIEKTYPPFRNFIKNRNSFFLSRVIYSSMALSNCYKSTNQKSDNRTCLLCSLLLHFVYISQF